MENEKEFLNIEELDQEIEKVAQESRKGGTIVAIVVSANFVVAGLFLIVCGFIYLSLMSVDSIFTSIGLTFLIIGIFFFVIFVIVLFNSINSLKAKSLKGKRYNDLCKLREAMMLRKVSDTPLNNSAPKVTKPLKNESKEDTLLRLLSEGKISVEEYKKLKGE